MTNHIRMIRDEISGGSRSKPTDAAGAIERPAGPEL